MSLSRPFWPTLKLDFLIQWRSQLYTIGIVAASITGGILSQGVKADYLVNAVPTVMILLLGGSTLLYVAGMILYEKEEGTLTARVVSPLSPRQYLLSKLVSLSVLGTLEGSLVLSITLFLVRGWEQLQQPLTFLLGAFLMTIIYTLLGIILVVRYQKITDFMIPVLWVAMILQMPVFYFLNISQSPLWLVIPTSAQALLIKGAFEPLTLGQWFYSVGYSLLLIAVLAYWAQRAFESHIIRKVG